MRILVVTLALIVSLFAPTVSVISSFATLAPPLGSVPDSLLEDLPASLIASLEARAKLLKEIEDPNKTYSSLVQDDFRWSTGIPITVAFLDGDADLHQKVVEATRQLTADCNIKFDFGYNPSTQTYRRWTTGDRDYVADIRVSFDMRGNWSLVGQHSVDKAIGSPTAGVGGYPHQRSLNLAGFTRRNLPYKWQHTIRHEFMHALGFLHEHQHPNGTCADNFRWDNDPGYENTWTVDSVFTIDSQGRRPGIYTYLSGAPNKWDRAKIDYNLKPVNPIGVSASGAVDAASVMLYRFDDLYYKRLDSPCVPTGGGEDLSDTDRKTLKRMYPFDAKKAALLTTRQAELYNKILQEETATPREKKAFRERVATLAERGQ